MSGSGFRRGGWYPQSKQPRRVDNGLKARTSRGQIGASWWSRRFLDVLESFAIGTRLTRGRTYARKGQVISLHVSSGRVTARVQGSRARPYVVRIGIDPFPELVWAKIEIALAEQALPSAKLLAGEVPPELEEIFEAAGAPLFPGSVEELGQECSCPDWEVPCKHLAATFYLLAEAFDEDPFLILRWRGRDREPLLGRLRELRSGEPAGIDSESQSSAVPSVGAAVALTGLSVADTADELDRFWLPPPALSAQPAALQVEPDLVLRQLPVPAGMLGGEALTSRLRRAYERFGTAEEPAVY
jgi:uncharacterized Zn finger protein